MQTGDQHAVAQFLGLKPEQVKINMLYAGGSFGRRANPAGDYLVEAASIAKARLSAGRVNEADRGLCSAP
jgi:isoquinoline 1-oxidoreductase beta subunit